MSNSIASIFRFTSIELLLDKIQKLWKEYDYQDYSLPINDHLSIEKGRKRNALYICLNGKRVIAAYFGMEGAVRGVGAAFAAGATLGLVDVYKVQFLTTDETVANQLFIREVATILKNEMPEIEKYMKNASEKRWGIK